MATPFISTPFLILSTLFFLFTTSLSSYLNNHTDLEALLAFKKYIHDDPLHALSSWNKTRHLCGWNGVSCSKRHPNRVVSISLDSQGLVGSLSPHIGNLSFLRIIDLQNNTFNGPIPQEIGRLRRLQVIEFSNNSFGGGIPTNLTQCTNLYYLNLIDNELTGGIVPEIASLVNLQALGLTENMLSGTIPPFLGNLTDLSQLSLGSCGFVGHRLHYAVMLFEPPVAEWVFNYREENPTARWSDFLEDVRRRFDPKCFVDYFGVLAKLCQTGSLADYNNEFERMLNRVRGVPYSRLVTLYVEGLQQLVRNQVKFQYPPSVAAAIALALEFDAAVDKQPAQPTFQRRAWQPRESRQ